MNKSIDKLLTLMKILLYRIADKISLIGYWFWLRTDEGKEYVRTVKEGMDEDEDSYVLTYHVVSKKPVRKKKKTKKKTKKN